MYDTIGLRLDGVGLDGVAQLSHRLANVTETLNHSTGETKLSGNVGNMHVIASAAAVHVLGSLAKYYLPDNTYTLTRKDTKEAMEKLSDDMGMNLGTAHVTRMDVAANFMMRHHPQAYFAVLGDCPRMNRKPCGSSLYYNNQGERKARTMIFYDKSKEVDGREGVMPDVYAGRNLLRYEMRWLSRLPQQLKETAVIGAMLYNEHFYHKVVQHWGDNYFNIRKQKDTDMGAVKNIKTAGDISDFINGYAISRLSQEEIDMLFGMVKKGSKADRIAVYRAKQKLRQLKAKAYGTEGDDLARELDGEVRQILKEKR